MSHITQKPAKGFSAHFRPEVRDLIPYVPQVLPTVGPMDCPHPGDSGDPVLVRCVAAETITNITCWRGKLLHDWVTPVMVKRVCSSFC